MLNQTTKTLLKALPPGEGWVGLHGGLRMTYPQPKDENTFKSPPSRDGWVGLTLNQTTKILLKALPPGEGWVGLREELRITYPQPNDENTFKALPPGEGWVGLRRIRWGFYNRYYLNSPNNPHSMETTQVIKKFQQLTVTELYELLRLRSEIFVVEQNCVFLDQDDKDQQCHHVLIYADGKLAAYSRLVPAGLSYPEISIGRVITSSAVRGKGFGRIVMELAIKSCREIFGPGVIRIGAQTYARPFYASLGFIPEGDVYDEDGIEHIEMVRKTT